MHMKVDILHCDANNFYASVEMVKDPSLRGKNLAVCGDPEKRHGIVLAKSEGAKARGVKTGQTIREALQRCPDLILLKPDFSSYVKYSKALFEIYTSYTDRVESFGLDECWLDVSGSHTLFGSSENIAESIRKRAREELGLTLSVGISFTKVFAKLGSDYKKPDAQTLISQENYRQIAWSLPVEDILMVGQSATRFFKTVGINTIGDLAKADEKILTAKLGQTGVTLKQWANGENDDPVKLYYESRKPESVGNGSTADHDLTTREECAALITALSERVATRLRKHGMQGCGVHLSVKYNNLSVTGKQMRLSCPTASATDLKDAALNLLDLLWREGSSLPVRALTVTAIYPIENGDYVPSSLFTEQEQSIKHTRLEQSIDSIRDKYGFGIITRGSLLKQEESADEYDEESKPFKRQ